MDKITQAFSDYRENLERLKEMQAVFDALDVTNVETKAAEVRAKLADPMKVDEIPKYIDELKAVIEEEKRKGKLREKINAWGDEGYKVDHMLDYVDTEDYRIAQHRMHDREKSIKALKKAIPDLERLADKENRGRRETSKAVSAAEKHIAVLEKKENLEKLPENERQEAIELRDKAKKLVKRLRDYLRRIGRPMCYEPKEIPPKEKGGDDIKRQLERIRRMAEGSKVKPEVIEKLTMIAENDIRELLKG